MTPFNYIIIIVSAWFSGYFFGLTLHNFSEYALYAGIIAAIVVYTWLIYKMIRWQKKRRKEAEEAASRLDQKIVGGSMTYEQYKEWKNKT
jgi:type VI protein secretion system component VasK